MHSTYKVTQGPTASEKEDFNWHLQETHKEVCDCQTEEDEVGGGVELPEMGKYQH